MLKGLGCRSNSFSIKDRYSNKNSKKGYLFAEVPYKIDLRRKAFPKAVTFPSLFKGYERLFAFGEGPVFQA